jgi:hypothetical protein
MSWDDNDPFNRGRELRPPRFGEKRGGNRDFTNAVATSDKADQKKIKSRQNLLPTPVELPPHIFPFMPVGSQPVDLRKLCLVEKSTVKSEFMRFQAPGGARTVFQAYAIFSDALDADLTEFVPEVDGQRVFPYHGDPTANYKMSLGLAPDISNNALIPAQLILEPNQIIIWYVTNLDASVDVAMGVRMVGYFDSSARRVDPRFGG